MTDIAITWPRTRELQSYLDELRAAVARGDEINYRVAREPKHTPERCYVVHSGRLRGYNRVLRVVRRGEGEVRHMGGGYWPAGWYIVRSPVWVPLNPEIPMPSFRGFRYIERP